MAGAAFGDSALAVLSQAQHLVILSLQFSWQAQHLVILSLQLSWQASVAILAQAVSVQTSWAGSCSCSCSHHALVVPWCLCHHASVVIETYCSWLYLTNSLKAPPSVIFLFRGVCLVFDLKVGTFLSFVCASRNLT